MDIHVLDLKMQAVITVLVLGFGVATALPAISQRIAGGAVATVNQYPEIASLLYSSTGTNYRQSCAGTILTTKVVMTSAQCVYGDATYQWRIRVGSSYANSGGTVYNVASITIHPNFNYTAFNNDIALIRTATAIVYSSLVRAGSIAGATYNLADNQVVWAAGWGRTSVSGSPSEQLRHVQIWTINQALCKASYASIKAVVTDNMVCAGWINVGGRDQCAGDSGGPLYHNGVVVGVCSWGQGCADARYPGVNARVSSFTTWIQANA